MSDKVGSTPLLFCRAGEVVGMVRGEGENMKQKVVVIDSRIACRLFKDRDDPVVEALSKKLMKNKDSEQLFCVTTPPPAYSFDARYTKKTNENYFGRCFSAHGIKQFPANGDNVKYSDGLLRAGRECIECAQRNQGCIVSNDKRVYEVANDMGITVYSIDEFVDQFDGFQRKP